MRHHFLAVVLASATAIMPASVVAAPSSSDAGPSAGEDETVVGLNVETSAMGDEASSTRAWVIRDGGAALGSAGISIADAGVDPPFDLQVVIAPEGLGYTVRIDVLEDGAKAPILTRGPSVCETCTRTEVVQLVQRELAWVAGWLSMHPKGTGPATGEPVDEDSAGGEDEETTLQIEPSSPETPRRPTLRTLGWAGVGVGAVGLGTLVGGLVVGLRDYSARGTPGDYEVPGLERPQRAGWAMVGIGGAAMVGGTLMVVFDVIKGRRSAVSAGPMLERHAAGVWVQRRF